MTEEIAVILINGIIEAAKILAGGYIIGKFLQGMLTE